MSPERGYNPFVTPDEFVAAIEKVVYEAAVKGIISNLRVGPAGRQPSSRGCALHEWYEALGPDDQQVVAEVVRESAHAAVFGFLCVLDGAVSIDDPPHAELRLTAIQADGRTSVLNEDSSPEYLHDMFNTLVHPPSKGWPPPRSAI